MTKAGMVFLGVTLLGAGTALAYSLGESKRKRTTTERGSMPALLNAACLSAARGDANGFYVSVQAAGTLLDGTAQPSLAEDAPNGLFPRYQSAIVAPQSLPLCEGDGPTLLGLANELASYGYDYESGQILRIALTEVS
jgi:hypothetical protein